MNLAELQKSGWYKAMPEVIRRAIDMRPPGHHYKFKKSNERCFIVYYNEPESGKLEDVTCIIETTQPIFKKDDNGGYRVTPNIFFSVKLDELGEWNEN